MNAHPLADALPLMEGAELDDLVASIAKHGLVDLIVRQNGLIVDGRNREIACKLAGVEPRYIEYAENIGNASPKGLRHAPPRGRGLAQEKSPQPSRRRIQSSRPGGEP